MRSRWLLLCAAILLVAPAGAQAQPAKPGAESLKDQARRLADEGERLFDAGDYKGAIARLRDADTRFGAATIKLLWAEAHERLGQLIEAREVYRRAAGEKLGPVAARELRDAQKTAEDAVARLDKVIPTLVIALAGEPPSELALTLDGVALPLLSLNQPRPLNPGAHTLSIERAGRPAETRSLMLRAGESRRIEITTPLAPPAAVPGVLPVARSYAAPATALALGGAGILVGAITGGIAMGKSASFREQCGPALQCPPSFQGELDGARIAGHVSTVGFAVGAVGIAMGATLLVWPIAANGPSAGHGAPVSVGVGPRGVVMTGRF